MKRKDVQFCIDLASDKDGFFLSEEYLGSKIYHKWKCKKGHIFLSKPNYVQQGNWCAICSNTAKKTIKDCIELAKQKNICCLSSEIVNSQTYLKWQCEYNHIWQASYSSVKATTKYVCPYCAKCAKYTINDCIQYAKNKNGYCLSLEYKNAKSILVWQCSKGHTWRTSFGNVNFNNSWCSQCSIYKSQSKLYDILNEIYENCTLYFNYRGFDWLNTSKTGKQEIDIFIKSNISTLTIAIEYDGQQHFFPIKKFGGKKNFLKTQQRDKIKHEKIRQHRNDINFFIRFNYLDSLTKENVLNKLKQFNIPTTANSPELLL